MTVIEGDRAVPDVVELQVGLLDAYAASHHVLGGTVEYQRLRLRAARRFLAEHPDVTVWITGPMLQRLADVSGTSSMWPLVTYALISTRVQADAEFLMVKNFGHSMRRWGDGALPARDRTVARRRVLLPSRRRVRRR